MFHSLHEIIQKVEHTQFSLLILRNAFILTNIGDIVQSPADDMERCVQHGHCPQEGNLAE